MSLERPSSWPGWLYQLPRDAIKRGGDLPTRYGGAEHRHRDDGVSRHSLSLPDKIRELRDSIFTSTGPASPVNATEDPRLPCRPRLARVW